MKRKDFLYLTILSLVAGGALGILCAAAVADGLFQEQARLVSAWRQTDSVYAALHQMTEGTAEIGVQLLTHAGYTRRFYFAQCVWGICACCVTVFFLFSLAIVWYQRRQERERMERIGGLTDYLTAVLENKECLLSRQEDGFSKLEDEIYKTVSELQLTREQAIGERQTLADNLADIAHQLKTPLTSMRLLTELLSRQDPEDAACLERLCAQTDRLEALVSALLTLSRLDAGALTLRRQPTDLYELVLRAMEPIEAQLHAAGIERKLEVPPEIQMLVDPMWTAEALTNVFKNCAEHTPVSGTITVCARNNPIFAELVITDSGCGFAKEELPHLFERFYRGRNQQSSGIGIGLSLTRAILHAQDAEIRADCAPGGGARFTIKFYHANEEKQAVWAQ